MNQQTELDLQPPRARRSDPKSSHLALVRAAKVQQSHANIILGGLRKHGPSTAHELEPRIGLTVVQIDRRIAELRRAGLVRHYVSQGMPVTRTTAAGSTGSVWEATQ